MASVATGNLINLPQTRSILRCVKRNHYYRQKIDACKATDTKMGWKIINLFTGKAIKTTLINDILVNDCLSFTSNLRQLV